MVTRLKFATIACGLLFTFESVCAQNWTQWRGPGRDGIVDLSAVSTWPDSLTRVWKVAVGTGHASPLVMGDRGYLHSRIGNEEVVSCLEIEDGSLIWQHRYEAPYEMNSAARRHGKGPKSTPLLYRKHVYTLGISGILSCLSAETGNLLWQKSFESEFENTSPLYGTATSPIAWRNLVIAYFGGDDRGALVAFDHGSGDLRWRWDGDGPGYTSTVIGEFGGVEQVITQSQNFCLGLAAATGEVLWKVPFTTAWDQNSVTPVLFNGRVIFSGLDKGTFSVKPEKDVQGTWWAREVWRSEDVSMYMSSAIALNDQLFGFGHKKKGRYFRLDAGSGNTGWLSEGRQAKNVALIASGDIVLALQDEAQLLVIDADVDSFRVLRRYRVADSPTWAHPVIVGSDILIKDEKTLSKWRIR